MNSMVRSKKNLERAHEEMVHAKAETQPSESYNAPSVNSNWFIVLAKTADSYPAQLTRTAISRRLVTAKARYANQKPPNTNVPIAASR